MTESPTTKSPLTRSDPARSGLPRSGKKVYLVGAGPGDPGLITVKGRECIHAADVLIYDYLAAPALLAHAAPDAERIYVGKKGGDHTLSQAGINALIIEKAQAGKIVTRLKGGDPFIFGRGGEEAELLAQKGIDFEIVPGVTSAIAAPAYAGIPLTHRDFNATVAFVTGHEDPTKETSLIDWSALATGIGTVVFLMGVRNLPKIVDQLISHGRAGDTPVGVIRWGTRPIQKSVTGTLDTIVTRVRQAGLRAPAIIVVGGVVALRDRLKWFENRPLFGRRILITRARQQASTLVQQLSALGADCIEFPTIEVAAPDSWEPMDHAIDRIEKYQWLIFTSVNGVDFFFKRLFEKGKDVRVLHQIRTAVIGPATAGRLRHFGFTSDIVPETYRAESVVDAFKSEKMAGQHVLLPRAEKARPVLPDALRQMGADVDEVTAYRTCQAEDKEGTLLAELEAGQIDLVTFTSSSTVRNFVSLLPADRVAELLTSVTTASIGPITSQTAADLGVRIDITATTYTIAGLVEAIRNVEIFPEPTE
ncbi:MAG: uroporphyrinogen-III C-methyltransferase [Deltaproteobacteria bacterium]|nr:MAG: uroporphyrinogen-III C-methyltransferase [Deltaproteobacteria bacterium]